MGISIFGTPTVVRSRIGNVLIDASLSESHIFNSSLTENPVEDGTIFTDNAVLQPVILEMEGRISDANQALLIFRGPGNSADAFKALVTLQRSRKTFSVFTGLNEYKNMMFKELSFPREALDGRSIRFTATIQEILVVGDDAATNRDRIAAGVKHTAQPSSAKGVITKLLT